MAEQVVKVGQVYSDEDGVRGRVACVQPRGRGFTINFQYETRAYGILISQSELLKHFPILVG